MRNKQHENQDFYVIRCKAPCPLKFSNNWFQISTHMNNIRIGQSHRSQRCCSLLGLSTSSGNFIQPQKTAGKTLTSNRKNILGPLFTNKVTTRLFQFSKEVLLLLLSTQIYIYIYIILWQFFNRAVRIWCRFSSWWLHRLTACPTSLVEKVNATCSIIMSTRGVFAPISLNM